MLLRAAHYPVGLLSDIIPLQNVLNTLCGCFELIRGVVSYWISKQYSSSSSEFFIYYFHDTDINSLFVKSLSVSLPLSLSSSSSLFFTVGNHPTLWIIINNTMITQYCWCGHSTIILLTSSSIIFFSFFFIIVLITCIRSGTKVIAGKVVHRHGYLVGYVQ